jgi:perosamine synthetase
MFPVCEQVSARSLALPFFPAMTEQQVHRVAEALGRALNGLVKARSGGRYGAAQG